VFDALKRAGVVFVAAIRKEVESPARQRLGEIQRDSLRWNC